MIDKYLKQRLAKYKLKAGKSMTYYWTLTGALKALDSNVEQRKLEVFKGDKCVYRVVANQDNTSAHGQIYL
jgi:hypothetical protein